MEELSGRVAVVTGAASGLGLAFSRRFAREGMKVVLADVEREPLRNAEAELLDSGASVLAVVTDVMHQDEVNAMADRAFDTFGNVHVLCNNAGVSGPPSGVIWKIPDEAWDWVMGVNFRGVIHGLRAFLPRMIERGEEGHVLNTASIAGLYHGGWSHPYGVSKHIVVRISEGLYEDLRARNLKISTSVLCPGMVSTNFMDSERNRPAEFGRATDWSTFDEVAHQRREAFVQEVANSADPNDIADEVVKGIREDRFYIIPCEPDLVADAHTRFERIISRQNPPLSSRSSRVQG